MIGAPAFTFCRYFWAEIRKFVKKVVAMVHGCDLCSCYHRFSSLASFFVYKSHISCFWSTKVPNLVLLSTNVPLEGAYCFIVYKCPAFYFLVYKSPI